MAARIELVVISSCAWLMAACAGSSKQGSNVQGTISLGRAHMRAQWAEGPELMARGKCASDLEPARDALDEARVTELIEALDIDERGTMTVQVASEVSPEIVSQVQYLLRRRGVRPEVEASLLAEEPCPLSRGADASVEHADRSKESIAAPIARALPRIKWCYDEALPVARASSKLLVYFIIEADGTVTSAEAQFDSVGAGVAGCVEEVMEDLRYSPSSKGITAVVYPFRFNRH